MKKTYETPVVEKVEFQYEEQVVASVKCGSFYSQYGDKGTSCNGQVEEHLN